MFFNRLAIVSVFAIGCTTVEQIPAPDGEMHFSINCKRSITNCYEKAAELCPSGYTLADKQDETTQIPSGTTVRRYNMLVKCK